MQKRLLLGAVAVIGLAGVATWGLAQAPTGGTSPAGARPRLTTSDSPGRDGLRASPRSGSPLDSNLSSGSASPAGTIRIDHALVTSLDPIKLPAREAGAVQSINVKKGVEVKVDDVLGQLYDRDAQTKKKVAELERDAAKIQADSTAQIDAAKKGEEVTRQNYLANQEADRKTPGSIAPFDMRRSLFEWERAQAQIKVAVVEKDVAYATQLAKEGQIEAAMNEIERRKIVAPIDGFVNEIYKHKGEWCQPGDPIMEIIRMDRVEIEGFVYAADASPAKILGKPVDVVVQLAGGETFKTSGTITFVSPVLEGSGRIRQFRVSTEIDNKKEQKDWVIQPGTEAEMMIHLNPPAPKPVLSPKLGSPAGKSTLPSTKVEANKPALPDTGTKADAKSESKTDAKTDGKAKPAETKADATKAGTETKTDSSKTDSSKADSSKSESAKTKSSKTDASKAESTKRDSSKTTADKLAPGTGDAKSPAPVDADKSSKATESKPADTKPAADSAKESKPSGADAGTKTKDSTTTKSAQKAEKKLSDSPTKKEF